ncbi:DUF507 family protein [bacterium]|nr:DUF507 family protein [candidate division CSSED10-310 bacterium]
MKLRAERIEYLAEIIINKLLREEMIILDDIAAGKSKVAQIITSDLMIEDNLDEEVRAILEEHADELDRQRIPYHEMFKAIKDKLAKDRNLIL